MVVPAGSLSNICGGGGASLGIAVALGPSGSIYTYQPNGSVAHSARYNESDPWRLPLSD
ncbi:hypothetical protein OG21DRAFT_1507309 [Imleria badia]|nr:hypothetical protein OG21DRAFT_1507309 [Imleria badia]